MMKISDIKNAVAMPLISPAYPKGPYEFINREFFIISYETDIDLLRAVVPEPLEVTDPIVKYEFIKMPDSSGFGSYVETGQVIPVSYKGETGGYVHSMYLDDFAPIAAGREIWGFPKKLATVSLDVVQDTLVGRLSYSGIPVAIGTMGYKYQPLDRSECAKSIAKPGFLLKLLPDVDGKPKIAQLVKYYIENVVVKSAWSGPAALQFFEHALAPVAALPIKKIISGTHILTDLRLPYGEVVYDYLQS
jgi:acetoacetate decarboxylase